MTHNKENCCNSTRKYMETRRYNLANPGVLNLGNLSLIQTCLNAGIGTQNSRIVRLCGTEY